MARMSPDSTPSAALAHVSRIAASIPSLSPEQLDELADAVEALTEAIGLQRDWPSADEEEKEVADASALVAELDMSPAEEPRDTGDDRADLISWLAYQRHEFQRKLRDLSAEQLVDWSVPPIELSVLGLVRHMRQMEAGYLGWGLSGEGERDFYGDDDYAGGDVDSVDADIRGWLAEVGRSDAAIAALRSLDDVGRGHGRTLRWTLIKMLHEYTLHAGQAHMLRFGALGELRR